MSPRERQAEPSASPKPMAMAAKLPQLSFRSPFKGRALLAAAALLAGCAQHTALSTDEREQLRRKLTHWEDERFLRISCFITPFFGDPSKKLLSPSPPSELRLVDDPARSPAADGGERVLPAGTRVRITQVEFPTAWVVAHRRPETPRDLTWIYLDAGSDAPFPLLLVLPRTLAEEENFEAELDRYVSVSDPSPSFSRWSEPVRDAVRTKAVIPAMPDDALEMSWGYPEQKRVRFESSGRNEEWIYSGGLRVAHLLDGRLESISRSEKK